MRTFGIVVAVIASFALAACGEPPKRAAPILKTDPFEGSLTPRPSKDALVVATVGDDAIYDVDVAHYAKAAGMSAREALDELIELTLLAQEARRRGLADDPDVVLARQRARARAYLAQSFERAFATPDDVPQEDVDLMWAKPLVRQHFDHPEVRMVHYMRFSVDSKKATKEEREAAHQAILELERRVKATPPKSSAELVAMGEALGKERNLVTAHSAYWTTEVGRSVKSFADAVFAIDKVGGISAPTETAWGWDLIYLEKIEPEKHWGKEQAAPMIREKIFAESRTRAFETWMNKLLAARTVQRFDERLDAVTVDSPLGMMDMPDEASPIPGVPLEPAP